MPISKSACPLKASLFNRPGPGNSAKILERNFHGAIFLSNLSTVKHDYRAIGHMTYFPAR